MNLPLTPAQRDRLELIAMHTGRPAGEVLLEAAQFLLDRDIEFWQAVQRGPEVESGGAVIAESALDARLADVLRR